MWEKLFSVEGPIQGFTFPEDGDVFLWKTDQIHRHKLAANSVAEVCSGNKVVQTIWDVHDQMPQIVGRVVQFYCDDEGDIPLGDHPDGTRLEVDNTRDALLLVDGQSGQVRQEIAFHMSRGWAYAGFTSDYNYLLVGDPTRFSVFSRRV
jgi:hypothetical protein